MESVEFKFEGSFDKLNDQLRDYEKNLKDLDRKTQDLGKAQSDAFSKAENAQQGAIESQKRAGKETREQIGIIQKLEREYQELDKRIKKATNTDDLKKFRQEQRKVVDELKNIGESTAPLTGAGGEIKSGFAGVGNFVGAQLGPMLAVGAAVGLATEALQTIKEVSKEVQEAEGFASQLTGESGNSLKSLTADARALAQTFDQDYREVLVATNTVAKEFNISQEEALNTIREGFISGANAQGDFLSQLQEYPAQFANAEGSAQQFVDVLITAQQEGIFSDKGVDAVKEFNLRIREQTTATSDAIRGLLGEEAGDELLAGVRDGSISSIEALKQVSEGLNNTEVSAQVLQTTLADVFGGAGEDAGLRFLQQIGDAVDGTIQLNEEAQKYADKQQRLLEVNQKLTEVQAELAEAVGGTSASLDELGVFLQVIGTEFLVFLVEMIGEWKRNIDLVLDASQPLFDLFLEAFDFIVEALGLANAETINWTAVLAKVAVGPIQFILQGFATILDLTITTARVIRNGFGDGIEFFKVSFENAINVIKLGINEVINGFNSISPVDLPSLVVGDIQDTEEIKKRLSAVTEEFSGFADRTKERVLSNLDGIFDTESLEKEAEEAGQKTGRAFAKAINNGRQSQEEFKELGRRGVEEINNEIERGLAQGSDGLFVTPITVETDEERFERVKNQFNELERATASFGDSLDRVAGTRGLGDLFSSLSAIFSEELPEGVSRSGATITAISAGVSVLGQAVSNFYQGQLQEQAQFISQLDEQISAQEENIDREKELQEEGLANSVKSEQEKLQALQEERAKAQEEAEKIQQRQLIADGLAQASALATAAAQVFAAEGTKGLVGILTAGAGLATLLATFASFKNKARSASVVAREGYTQLLGGDLHTNGGVNLGFVEAERGEQLSIFNRDATRKWGTEIEHFTNALNAGKVPDFGYLTSPMVSPEDVQKMSDSTFISNHYNVDVAGIEAKLDKLIRQGSEAPKIVDKGSFIEITIGTTTTRYKK